MQLEFYIKYLRLVKIYEESLVEYKYLPNSILYVVGINIGGNRKLSKIHKNIHTYMYVIDHAKYNKSARLGLK